MTTPTLLRWFTVFLCLYFAVAYSTFQTKIPNGNRVPDPCNTDLVWQGVGHKNPAGGGDRNPFGLDFAANNFNWTTVCSLDSDGDGLTNGQELGDANCSWIPGDFPPYANITHPGVCEPLSSPECHERNSWLTCSSGFDCPAIQQPGVEQLQMRIPPTRIVPKETTYMCRAYALPNDTDYHIIATTPIINSTEILHHVIVYMCETFDGNDTVFTEAVECFMGSFNCISIIGVWGVGSSGQCLHDTYGFRMGRTGFKYAVVEVHWNNPLLRDDIIDSSGMTFYYTRDLRDNDGVLVLTGQGSLEIPPRQSSVTQSAMCSRYCTKNLAHNVYITTAILHMHLLGKSGQIELYRDGVRYATLVNSTSYDFNTPPIVEFDQPYEFRPNDEIRVNCEFQSLDRNTTTRFGEGTMDEMCYGFITYYPADLNFVSCQQHRSVDVCSNTPLACDIDTFNILAKDANKECSTYPECSQNCATFIKRLVETECLDGDMGLLLEDFNPEITYLLELVETCDLSNNLDTTTMPPNGVSGIKSMVLMTVISFMAVPALIV